MRTMNRQLHSQNDYWLHCRIDQMSLPASRKTDPEKPGRAQLIVVVIIHIDRVECFARCHFGRHVLPTGRRFAELVGITPVSMVDVPDPAFSPAETFTLAVPVGALSTTT